MRPGGGPAKRAGGGEGHTPLVGACGAGIVTPAGIFEEGVAVVALAGEGIRVTTAMTEFTAGDPWETGKRLGRQLRAGEAMPSGMVVFPDGLAGSITEMLQGLYDVLGPGFKYAGGGTGDNLRFIRTYQLTGGGIASGAVAAALISGCAFGVAVEHGRKPIGSPLVVTRARGKVVYELDTRPAFAVYSERLGGIEPEKFQEFGLRYPMGLPNAAGRFIVRDPLRVLPDGAIELVTEVPPRAVAYLMHAGAEDLLQVTRQVATASLREVACPAFALVFTCVSRSLLLGNGGREFEVYREVFGSLPFAGFLTFGEVAAYDDVPVFHNKTLVVAVEGAA
ncbi:MAG: FIST signal transduction protein [Desulfotomaculales bacterium]